MPKILNPFYTEIKDKFIDDMIELGFPIQKIYDLVE